MNKAFPDKPPFLYLTLLFVFIAGREKKFSKSIFLKLGTKRTAKSIGNENYPAKLN